MELTYKERTIKYSIYALVILAAALVQNVLSAHLTIGGARCFILVPVAVALGIDEDEKAAAVYGLLGGILLDMVSAQTRLFNAFFLTVACYLFSALVTFIFRSTLRFRLAAGLVSVVLYCLLYWVCNVLIGGGAGSGTVLLRLFLPSAVYTAALTPFVCVGMKALSDKLNKIEKIAD